MLAYIENPQEEKWESFSEPGAFQAAWDEKLSHFSITSGDEKLDRMANIWNQYQCVVTYNMARSASPISRAVLAGASVAEHLDTPHGVVILDPPYKEYHLELGEVSSYPPGYKENGGIFCSQMIAGKASRRHGEAKNSWLTGTAAWNSGTHGSKG